MLICGFINRHYDSADIPGPEIFNMRWFLAQEIVQKWWFLGPENYIMALQDFGPQKASFCDDIWAQKTSFWDDFWAQKSSLWPREP